MRQEDREIDGPDIEKAEERKRENELVEEKEDEVYDLDGLPETSIDKDRTATVIAAMRTILAGEQIVVNDLKLPKRQLIALESLKTAVDGKDSRLSRFVFAEDRRALLEQALAVLQPEIAAMIGADLFKEMFDRVGELREKLNVLEDSEEELIEGRHFDAAKDESDSDDKDDDDKSDDSDLDDKKAKKKKGKPKAKAKPEERDLSLDGPERPVEPKGPTTLTGPALKEEKKGPSTLEGPAIKEEKKGPSTLEGPAIKEEKKGPSTLEGPALKEAPKGPTTVGDMKEIEAIAAASTPRWRREGG